MIEVDVKVLKDKDIERLTKSVCLGDGLWVIVQRSRKGALSRSWVFRYRSLDRDKRTRKGEVKRKELWIGSTKKFDIGEAREIARQAQRWLIGIPGKIAPKDPILKWREERANEIKLGDDVQNRANVTVAQYIDLDYIPNVLDPAYPEYFTHDGTGQKRINTTRQKQVKALTRLRDGVGPCTTLVPSPAKCSATIADMADFILSNSQPRRPSSLWQRCFFRGQKQMACVQATPWTT